MKEVIHSYKQQLTEGHLKRTLTALLKEPWVQEKAKHHNGLIALNGRFQQLQKDNAAGVLTNQDKDVLRNKIRQDLLEWLVSWEENRAFIVEKSSKGGMTIGEQHADKIINVNKIDTAYL